ncbi:DUF2336 domain-containing protein [Phenylobacterium sp. J367]|uniref:DUF2336 domain-containing protein n=1 Tax=Phenylobacterium sp. J367 TaxID=2898435 RepID=UPI002151856F|nr:DUF2336 domain-containing protein [Phenylobacterium sp. J367]MCR5880834.1 DUF2336 domain-containing protein [Phenylobacterium sp. J367]
MGLALGSESLLELAKSRAPGDRERLLLGIVDLCGAGDAPAAVGEPAVQSLLSSIFTTLVIEAERDIRRRLADRLARVDWAPPALINVLALDEIEIARPIIAGSPVLKDHDLVRLLVEATIEHQIEVARRPQLGGVVVAAILRQAEPAVLTALANNPTADLSCEDMRQLVAAARKVAALRTPLSRHPRLTADLAQQLYVWVGQALRGAIAERFRLDTAALDQSIADAVRDAHGGAPAEAEGLVIVAREGEREEMECKLIDKLHAADQLKPGYLVRALREGRLSLFATALARLGGFDLDHVRRAIDSDRPELLALACTAVGIDRSVYPTILDMVRRLNDGRPAGLGTARAAGVLGPVHQDMAGHAFRQAVGAR